MKRIRFFFIVPVLMLMLILAACGNTSTTSGDGYGTSTTTPSTPTPTTSTTSTGTVINTTSVTINGKTSTALTNEKGWTLYYFTPDTATTSACAAAPCTTTWPPVVSNNGTPTSKSTLPGTLGVQTNANGSQVTYNGHDLYTYSGDSGPGQTNGEGASNGKWHVATTDLSPIGGSSATPTTGGSYPSY
jgi:predicted lipoprotein with Yx(FWY)xxD motif